MSIDQGSIVTYQGTWPIGTYFGFVDYTPDVLNDLNAAGLAVQGKTGGFNVTNAALGNPFQIGLTLQVQNGTGFNSTDDILAIISNAVAKEQGNPPIAQSIPYVTAPGGTAQATGQATAAASQGNTAGGAGHQCGDPTWGFFDDPTQWLTCLSQKGLSTLGLVFVGLLIGVAFIVFADHETRL